MEILKQQRRSAPTVLLIGGAISRNNPNISIQALSKGKITRIQINNFLLIFKRLLKPDGNFKFRIATTRPVTCRPPESRIGKGKGAIITYISYVKKHEIIVEITCINKLKILSCYLFIKNRVNFQIKLNDGKIY